jgi:hypothetical protein
MDREEKGRKKLSKETRREKKNEGERRGVVESTPGRTGTPNGNKTEQQQEKRGGIQANAGNR